MLKIMLKPYFGVLVFSAVAGASLGFWVLNKSQPAQPLEMSQNFKTPELPPGIPAANDNSIKIAMELFKIQLPEHVSYPVFDATLQERGITTGYILGRSKQVKIGPSAFISWSILGSTLGHEIEVHGRQSFLKITVADSANTLKMSAKRVVGQWIPSLKPTARESFEAIGTWKAERDAYMYEVNSSKRFGLTSHEQWAIKRVMEEYFPSQPTAKTPPNS